MIIGYLDPWGQESRMSLSFDIQLRVDIKAAGMQDIL